MTADLLFRYAMLAAALALPGCALQPPAATPLAANQSNWSSSYAATQNQPSADFPSAATPAWWKALNEPLIDAFVAAAGKDSPTLALAMARIDEAQAALGIAKAASLPKVTGDVSASRGNSKSLNSSAETRASANLNLSWDIDLFGRLRHSKAASQQRLMSKEADASATRLALQTQVGDTVLSSRACYLQLAHQLDDERSLQQVLEITRLRQSLGVVSATETARAQASLADSSSLIAKTHAACLQFSHALVALTGLSMSGVQTELARHQPVLGRPIPKAPDSAVGLPASVIAQHPNVLAALRTADAAYEDMGRDKAARLPSISLTALLGSNWLGLASSFARNTAWSLGPSASVALFDGGAGQAQVQVSRARFNQALAQLESTVRTTAQDIENALAQQGSTQQRQVLSGQSLQAQQVVFDNRAASLRLGQISRQDFEEAQRALNAAVSSHIGAQRDHAQAWVALVKASGNALVFSSTSSSLNPSLNSVSSLSLAP
jgi:outer membrane protein, multidrug efflux system